MTTQAVHEARRTRWPSALGLASVHCAQLQRVQGSSASCVVLFGLFTIMHNTGLAQKVCIGTTCAPYYT